MTSNYYVNEDIYKQKRLVELRNSNKKLINKITEIDPKLGKELSEKYKDDIEKVYLKDFTIKDLLKMKKDGIESTEVGKKYLQQEVDKKMAEVVLTEEYKKRVTAAVLAEQNRVNQEQVQRTIRENIQRQSQEEINRQIQQQVQSQIEQQMQLQVQQQIQQEMLMQVQQQTQQQMQMQMQQINMINQQTMNM